MSARNAPASEGFKVETGLLATEVASHDDLYSWKHRLGKRAPLAFSTLAPAGPSHTTPDSSLVIWGRGDSVERNYRTQANSTMAIHLLDSTPVKMRSIGKLWGTALNTVHKAQPGSRASFTGPRTLQRAAAWLDGSWQPARNLLGAATLARLNDWAARMSGDEHRVLVHGCPGMAHWVLTADARSGSLLTGEDTGFANPVYDFGWVLGEIAEIKAFHPLLLPDLEQLEQGLLDCFSAVHNPADLDLARAFRLVHHAFDWHHYAGASIEQSTVLLRLATNYISGPVSN
ncbi:hypothetical protein [Arthrobacter sp. NIO-1057]|uniref:hypothetical protein n=1 Tax=Arthrobacter sp. NIO-1057 TaxID=993071 RepID=UPI00071E41E7|nr:hypothetical protein [Arthrobacter sp. NIO-1057]KSU65031.1 hypothetical protein AS038_13830 [Arthrobacter sp. NIO-1057]SCC46135.1 hypothetical protein GA0061084_2816 [Arthrobacter sp. NIO-1057]